MTGQQLELNGEDGGRFCILQAGSGSSEKSFTKRSKASDELEDQEN
jgi:hypothetical protein